MGPLISLFWNSGDVCPGFQSQGGSPHLHALLPAHSGILSFASGATPADLLTAKPFLYKYMRASIGGARDLFAKLVFCYRYHRSTISNI